MEKNKGKKGNRECCGWQSGGGLAVVAGGLHYELEWQRNASLEEIVLFE